MQQKEKKNDEFYTRYEDIENELKHYKNFLNGKTIYCNTDDFRTSNFVRFFKDNFVEYGLQKLISTNYDLGNGSYLYQYDGKNETIETLEGNGDFRSLECRALLEEADVVVTNPPFSLFREFIALMQEYDKKFLVVGNVNAVTYKEMFPLIKENKLWMGATCFNGGATHFIAPIELYDPKKMYDPKNAYLEDGKFMWRVNGVRWFTNIDHQKRNTPIDLYKTYNPTEFPKYDNYDAIEVSKVANIPMDWGGVMGVPISMVDKYCPEQFEIVGLDRYVEDNPHYGHRFTINGKETYARILIRHKK